MKVILLSDVKKLGKKGDIVEVSDGYGRNFLLNKNLAVMATKKSMEADAEDLKKQLAKITLEFHVKTGEGGRVFGSVSTKQIVAQLHETYGIHVDKRKVIDNDAITSLGYTDVKVDLYRNKVIGTIRVHVNG